MNKVHNSTKVKVYLISHLTHGKNPVIRIFEVIDKKLYHIQDSIFKNDKFELNASYIFVEGSSYLRDDLIVFTGLDDKDITIYFLVVQYIKCKEKFNNG
ncbi:MAG: hypothetical protein ACLSXC_03425 [Beduini sp.]